jgi:hypothetical protein
VVDTSGTERDVTLESEPVDIKVALRHSASAAIFCRADSINGFRFDKNLGLGTKFKAAEDLDLILHLLSSEANGIFSKALKIGHPLKNNTFDYFPGSIAAMRKYLRRWPILSLLMIRRLAHGAVYILTGGMRPSILALAIWAALVGTGSKPSKL